MSELNTLIDTYSGIIDNLSLNAILTEKETFFLSSIEILIKDQDKKIYELYKLLDDIDTASDVFKGNHEGYTKFVNKWHNKRFEIIDEAASDRLYAEYYNSNNINEVDAKDVS